MIKKSCNVIGWEHILIYNLKLGILNWRKKASVYFEINQSFVLNYFLPRDALRTPGKSRQVWAWQGMPGHTKPKVVVWHDTFPLWISPIQAKNKKMMHYSQKVVIKESWILIGWENYGQELVNRNFPRYEVCSGKHRNLMSFILGRKTYWQNFKKLKKTPFSALFAHFGAKNNFHGKSAFATFFCFQISLDFPTGEPKK